jgi:hypothetical protein
VNIKAFFRRRKGTHFFTFSQELNWGKFGKSADNQTVKAFRSEQYVFRDSMTESEKK